MASENIVITGLTISDWLMILAVLLGPILAVQIQKFIERKKEKSRKEVASFQGFNDNKISTFSVSACIGIKYGWNRV